ncbi:MAG: hypothetical protein HRT43_11230 [Campylobacteraceae bacterium]|nr:hypothetical protein [Campylobacteraceae bacterium]
MESKKLKSNMKTAIVDQILLWVVLLVGFVTLLFITVDYSAVMRLKNNNDTLAQQGARLIALGKTNDEVAESLNNIKNVFYADISGGDITCEEVTATSYQVIFNVISTYDDAKILTISDSIYAKVAVFNESNSNEITCTLTMTNN